LNYLKCLGKLVSDEEIDKIDAEAARRWREDKDRRETEKEQEKLRKKQEKGMEN
jgi:hypothetical protein